MPAPLTVDDWEAVGRILAISDAQEPRWQALYHAATMDVEHLHRVCSTRLDELSGEINAARGDDYATPRSAELYLEMVETRIALADAMDARYRDAIFLMHELLAEEQILRIELAHRESMRRLVFGALPTNHPWLARDPVEWLVEWRDEWRRLGDLSPEADDGFDRALRSEPVVAAFADLARDAVRFDRDHVRGGARATAHHAETMDAAESLDDPAERDAYLAGRFEAYAALVADQMEDQWRLAASCDRLVHAVARALPEAPRTRLIADWNAVVYPDWLLQPTSSAIDDYGEVWELVRERCDGQVRADGDALRAAAVALRPIVLESMRDRFDRDFKAYMTTRMTLPEPMQSSREHHTRLRRRLAEAERAFIDHVAAAVETLGAGPDGRASDDDLVAQATDRLRELEAEDTGSGWMLRLAAAATEAAIAADAWDWPQTPAYGGQRRRTH